MRQAEAVRWLVAAADLLLTLQALALPADHFHDCMAVICWVGLQVARHLAGSSYSAIYCSDLLRAVQTAACIAAATDLPVFQEAQLRERHLGCCQVDACMGCNTYVSMVSMSERRCQG